MHAPSTPLAVLTEIDQRERREPAVDDVGRFLENTLDNLGEIAPYTVLDLTDDVSPSIALYTSTGRTYGITLPGPEGPFELWAFVEMSITESRRYQELREREEVLAQALNTTRLAWNVNDDTGWIGRPIAVAADTSELDADLAEATATALERLFFTVERICATLTDREAVRRRRRRIGVS